MKERIAFSLAACLVVLGILEGGARLFGPGIMPIDRSMDVGHGESLAGVPDLLGDAATGWRARGGTHRDYGVPQPTHVNSRGLRNAEIPLEKTPGRTRILLLGDSSVYGVRVTDEQSFGGLLEKRLQDANRSVEVLNGGCPGFSSWQTLQALEDRLLAYSPDLVVIATLWSDAQGSAEPDAARFGNGRGRSWLSHSAFYVWLQAKIRRARWSTEGPERIEFQLDPVPGAPPFGNGPKGPNKLAPTHRVPLKDYKANLKEMATKVRAQGGEVAFLVLPCFRDLLIGRVGDFRDAYREAMIQVAKELDAPLFNSPVAFADGDVNALFFDDVHPTAKGHARIASLMEKSLLEKVFSQPLTTREDLQ
jgi:lysophospholipase L1-like esterase